MYHRQVERQLFWKEILVKKSSKDFSDSPGENIQSNVEMSKIKRRNLQ